MEYITSSKHNKNKCYLLVIAAIFYASSCFGNNSSSHGQETNDTANDSNSGSQKTSSAARDSSSGGQVADDAANNVADNDNAEENTPIEFPQLPDDLRDEQTKLNIDGVQYDIDKGGIPNLGGTCYMSVVMQILTRFYGPEVMRCGKELRYFDYALSKVQQDINRGDAVSVLNAWNFFNALKMEVGGKEGYRAESGGYEPMFVLRNIWKCKELKNPMYSVKCSIKFKREYRDKDEWGEILVYDFSINTMISSEEEEKGYSITKACNNACDGFEVYLPSKEHNPISLCEFPKKLCVSRGWGKEYTDHPVMYSEVQGDIESVDLKKGGETKRYNLKAFIFHVCTNDQSETGGWEYRDSKEETSHVVVYIKNENNWVLYNDECVNNCSTEEAKNITKYASAWFYDQE